MKRAWGIACDSCEGLDMKSLIVRAIGTGMRMAWERLEGHLWATGAYDIWIITVDSPALRLKREPGDSKTRISEAATTPSVTLKTLHAGSPRSGELREDAQVLSVTPAVVRSSVSTFAHEGDDHE